MRTLRLGIGLFGAYKAYVGLDVLLALVAVFLLYQAIFNVGCCATSDSCGIDNTNDLK